MEASVRIENRSQLIYLLTEAAELEHGIMCCYLFTAFSLKNDVSEGITEEQLRGIRRWRRLISGIAVEEMLHLAAACNLLTAVGGAPQLRRPNLPVSPRAYPDTFKLGLIPFSLDSLDLFISIEKPESLIAVGGQGRQRVLPSLVQPRLSDIFSSEREYETQGRLYRGIEDGIKYLAQKYSEGGLFIGPPEAQTANRHFTSLKELQPVSNLESALSSIDLIVRQGEGASVENKDSHYSKFVLIRDEFEALLKEDPAFQPARPVLSNLYAIRPTDKGDSRDINIIDDPHSMDVCNLFDGCYELMIQMLGRLFVHAEESDEEFVTLSSVCEGLMMEALSPLGSLLTSLPAGPAFPSLNAGPSFRLSRGASIPTQRDPAWRVFEERLRELVSYCRYLQAGDGAAASISRVAAALARFADRIAVQRRERGSLT